MQQRRCCPFRRRGKGLGGHGAETVLGIRCGFPPAVVAPDLPTYLPWLKVLDPRFAGWRDDAIAVKSEIEIETKNQEKEKE